MINLGPSKYHIGEEDCVTKRVRSCVVAVIQPKGLIGGVRGTIHYNGNSNGLANFLHEAKQAIPNAAAKLAGAGCYVQTGAENLEAVVSALAESGIPVVSQDTGGHYERTVIVNGEGVFSKQKEYSPFSSAAVGLYAGYEDLEGRKETVQL